MKVRAILKSLLFAYALTGVALLLLALVLFAFDLGETAVDAGIIIIYVLACFMGGFMAGKIVRKDKYLWGVITGLAYYVLLLTVSIMAKGGWDMSAAHAVTTFFMCTGGGDPEVRALWRKMNEWVYAGFDVTYKALGVSFDKIYYESETYLEGKRKFWKGLTKDCFSAKKTVPYGPT